MHTAHPKSNAIADGEAAKDLLYFTVYAAIGRSMRCASDPNRWWNAINMERRNSKDMQIILHANMRLSYFWWRYAFHRIMMFINYNLRCMHANGIDLISIHHNIASHQFYWIFYAHTVLYMFELPSFSLTKVIFNSNLRYIFTHNRHSIKLSWHILLQSLIQLAKRSMAKYYFYNHSINKRELISFPGIMP